MGHPHRASTGFQEFGFCEHGCCVGVFLSYGCCTWLTMLACVPVLPLPPLVRCSVGLPDAVLSQDTRRLLLVSLGPWDGHASPLVLSWYQAPCLLRVLTLPLHQCFLCRAPVCARSSRPSTLLLAAGSTALSLSTILACVWPKGDVDGIAVEGLARGGYTLWPLWIWLYCVVFWFVQDTFKVGCASASAIVRRRCNVATASDE